MRLGCVVVALGCALTACSPPANEVANCAGVNRDALFNATTDEAFLGIPARQIRAIVQITNGTATDDPLCTGAFVAPKWIVTAKHCLAIASPYVVLEGTRGQLVEASIVDHVSHASADVALLEVEIAGIEVDLEPIETPKPAARAVEVGEVVEFAGYGLTEEGGSRELRFLAEPVVSVDEATIVVSGHGANGACLGDSGGPLLLRDSRGALVVGGVLTGGSATCLDEDRYVRLDAIAPWLAAVTGGYSSEFAECGGIGEAGRCLYGSAVWCNGDFVTAEPCDDGTRCGWSDLESGFRCVRPSTDPCFGVDSLGACRDDSAVWCEEGAFEQRRCDCGGTCRIDGRTGGPVCTDEGEP